MDVMRDTEIFLEDCYECSGQGEAQYEVGVPDYDHGGYLTDEWRTCQRCHGTGQLEVERDISG